MSWLPSNDPVLGDKRSCDALELVIVPRARDLGGFEVRRALPHGKRQMVGPFIFFDQMGPVQFMAGQGMDVRPHPHIGLATVTYLFAGRVMHRDSEGNALEITPGAMNLMTAGSGIAHSERTPAESRAHGDTMFGIQSWIALPQAPCRPWRTEGCARTLSPDRRSASPARSACSLPGSTPKWCWRREPARRSTPTTRSARSMWRKA